MTYKILLSSRTGNTNMLAAEVRKAMQGHTCVYDGPPAADTPQADLCLVGFWTDKGNCDEPTALVLPQLCGERIFFFGTAGFGQSETYFHQIVATVAAQLGEGCTIRGSYMCQGRMAPAIRQRYESQLAADPDNSQIVQMIANFDLAKTHPNQTDLEGLRAALTAVL